MARRDSMNRRLLHLCVAIPALLLGVAILVGGLMSVNPVQVSKQYLVRSRHYIERLLEYRDVPSVSLGELERITETSPSETVLEMLGQID
jgi:hypothetical protein